MASVGLNAAYMHRYPHEFSGGQRQRGLARSLALNPRPDHCRRAGFGVGCFGAGTGAQPVAGIERTHGLDDHLCCP